MKPHLYHLTPLPKHATTPLAWLALCWFGLIFSPFIGFAIVGKVGVEGLEYGLFVAIFPLSGLTAIALLRWRAWRNLPQHIKDEWSAGRVFPPEGAPPVVAPIQFFDKRNRMNLSESGVAVSQYTLLSMRGMPQAMEQLLIAKQVGEWFIAWADIAEWVVDDDSDSPNLYRLQLRAGGVINIRRFKPDSASESNVLDAVRSIGKLPVRLLCDVLE